MLHCSRKHLGSPQPDGVPLGIVRSDTFLSGRCARLPHKKPVLLVRNAQQAVASGDFNRGIYGNLPLEVRHRLGFLAVAVRRAWARIRSLRESSS